MFAFLHFTFLGRTRDRDKIVWFLSEAVTREPTEPGSSGGIDSFGPFGQPDRVRAKICPDRGRARKESTLSGSGSCRVGRDSGRANPNLFRHCFHVLIVVFVF